MVENITLTGLEKADLPKIFLWKTLPQQNEWGKAHFLGLKKGSFGSVHAIWIFAHK